MNRSRETVRVQDGSINIARRDLLKGAAALLVAVSIPPAAMLTTREAAARVVTRTLNPAQLDTWLAVASDGGITAYWGKMDMGQGVDTAIAQIIAEELDVDVDRVAIISGDSALCPDQGGASGSTGVNRSGAAFRAAAAEARLALFEKASKQLALPVDALDAADGVVFVKAERARSVSYAELVSDHMFNTPINWNGRYGNSLALTTRAKPKDPKDYRIVGTSVPRKDLPGKILATTEYLHDVNVPGMLHGRMVRPPAAGAHVKQVDKASVESISGVRIVVHNDFVGVVAPSEWDAIRAARQLDVSWDESDAGFPTTSVDLFDWIRSATPARSLTELDDGDVETALNAASKRLTAEYEWPFQSHARMAPAAAVADVRDGEAVVWTDSQKPYDTGSGAKRLLETPINGRRIGGGEYSVRSIWMPGPGSYGRSDAGDGAMDAVVLSAAVGAPVRMQWMRNEGHAWDPKGPASVISCRAGFDDSGDVSAYHFHIKGFSRSDQNSRENQPGEVLAGHLLGHESTPEWTMQTPAESYRFANKRYTWDALAPLRKNASPLRTAHFRDPYGPEVHFASESFIDELAYANAVDPLEFRLRYVGDERDAAVLRAAAELAGWQKRTAPGRKRDSRGNYIGTGIACAQRNGSVNAVVAEVEVNPASGRIWVRRMFVGADHGLIVNPFTLDRVIEGNLLQATSRTLFEEVIFDRKMVRITDWLSYPILESLDAPLEIRINKINRPELDSRGAGEPTTRVTPPAIANAFFDATGVRLRRVPFTRERVKAALSGIQ
ncbi:MAG: xanthine dehydrogenase family protein molybdopterin-binding subunit [Woeseiaceae bacterium]|nr:xanthine dehydrogenase family protein molybdopterin-binding subunit [Woeseiaceae bacterium]